VLVCICVICDWFGDLIFSPKEAQKEQKLRQGVVWIFCVFL